MATSTLQKAETIEVTDDYKIAIPPALAESLGIHPGQKLQALFYQGRIELMPEVHPRDLRGALPDLDTTVDRDEDRI